MISISIHDDESNSIIAKHTWQESGRVKTIYIFITNTNYDNNDKIYLKK